LKVFLPGGGGGVCNKKFMLRALQEFFILIQIVFQFLHFFLLSYLFTTPRYPHHSFVSLPHPHHLVSCLLYDELCRHSLTLKELVMMTESYLLCGVLLSS
jgi:hypothetical protein